QAKIDVSHVVLNPLKLKLNGGAVDSSADLDLSIPGWKYKIAAALQSVPLPPLVNSFAPDRKGEINGTLTANANADGAGITGASMKKSLTGKFDAAGTNLNISIDKIRSRVLRLLVNVVAAVPELVTNPGAAVGTFLGKGGLTQELAKSPIEDLSARGA